MKRFVIDIVLPLVVVAVDIAGGVFGCMKCLGRNVRFLLVLFGCERSHVSHFKVVVRNEWIEC